MYLYNRQTQIIQNFDFLYEYELHAYSKNTNEHSDNRVQISQREKKNATDIIQNQFLYINSLKTEYVQMHRGISEVLQRPC